MDEETQGHIRKIEDTLLEERIDKKWKRRINVWCMTSTLAVGGFIVRTAIWVYDNSEAVRVGIKAFWGAFWGKP